MFMCTDIWDIWWVIGFSVVTCTYPRTDIYKFIDVFWSPKYNNVITQRNAFMKMQAQKTEPTHTHKHQPTIQHDTSISPITHIIKIHTFLYRQKPHTETCRQTNKQIGLGEWSFDIMRLHHFYPTNRKPFRPGPHDPWINITSSKVKFSLFYSNEPLRSVVFTVRPWA